MPSAIYHREENILYLGSCRYFSPWHVYYVGDYSRANDAASSIYSPVFFCGVMNNCGEMIISLACMLYMLRRVWGYIISFHHWILWFFLFYGSVMTQNHRTWTRTIGSELYVRRNRWLKFTAFHTNGFKTCSFFPWNISALFSFNVDVLMRVAVHWLALMTPCNVNTL